MSTAFMTSRRWRISSIKGRKQKEPKSSIGSLIQITIGGVSSLWKIFRIGLYLCIVGNYLYRFSDLMLYTHFISNPYIDNQPRKIGIWIDLKSVQP